MTSKSAEFACGQILYNIKESKLNYLVRETPYSVSITLRKKYVKEAIENISITPQSVHVENNLDVKKKLEAVESENARLRKKIIDKDKEIGTTQFENGELEVKNEQLDSEVVVLNDKIEDMYRAISKLKSGNEGSINHVDKKLKVKEVLVNEMEEKIMILENVVESRNMKISSLEEKIRSFEVKQLEPSCLNCDSEPNQDNSFLEHKTNDHNISADEPSTSKSGKCEIEIEDESLLDVHIKSDHMIVCDECDFKTYDTQELKDHMEKFHLIICENCSLEFKSDKKLSDHMCRIHILNPSCGDSYTKNWTIFEGCTRIFSKFLEKEVVYLHSQQCIDNLKSCPDMLKSYDTDIFNYDGEIWHAPISEFFSEGKMKWGSLSSHFDINIE